MKEAGSSNDLWLNRKERPMDDELLKRLRAVKLGGRPNLESVDEDNPTLGSFLTGEELEAILLLIKQDREATRLEQIYQDEQSFIVEFSYLINEDVIMRWADNQRKAVPPTNSEADQN